METPLVVNALSRRDNKTYICSDCGTDEALFDFDIQIQKNKEAKWLKQRNVNIKT